MILKWRILSATNDLDRVSAVALPKLPISLTNTDLKVASDTQFYPGLGMLGPGVASTVSGPVCDGRRAGGGWVLSVKGSWLRVLRHVVIKVLKAAK